MVEKAQVKELQYQMQTNILNKMMRKAKKDTGDCSCASDSSCEHKKKKRKATILNVEPQDPEESDTPQLLEMKSTGGIGKEAEMWKLLMKLKKESEKMSSDIRML